jgi:hypothetical protein
MTPQQVDELISKARAQTQARIQRATADFGLGRWQRFDLDLTSASMRFFDALDAEQVRAGIQAAGSWSPASESWMWSWENDSIPASACARLETVRAFGAKNDLPLLRAGFQPCDEGTAWSVASVAAQLLDAACLYCVPATNSRLFLLLFDLRRMQ